MRSTITRHHTGLGAFALQLPSDLSDWFVRRHGELRALARLVPAAEFDQNYELAP